MLIVVDGERSPEVGRLLAVWRAEALAIAHYRRTPNALAGELVLARAGANAFEDANLNPALEAMGATTLTLCGTGAALGASAKAAVDLGYRVFVVGEASTPPMDDVRVVSLETAAAAACMARARQRLRAARASRGG